VGHKYSDRLCGQPLCLPESRRSCFARLRKDVDSLLK